MKSSTAHLFTVLCCLGLFGLSAAVGGHSHASLGGLPAVVLAMLIAVGLQWLAFVPAYLLSSERFYDLVGTSTFLLMAGLGLWVAHANGQAGVHHFLIALAVGLWSLRLVTFLTRRIHETGKDGRFDEIKHSFPRFLMAWTAQAMWIFTTSFAMIILLTSKRPFVLDAWVVIGLCIWAVGWTIEVVADQQKKRFRLRNASGERWIDEGLWAYARHPNYFGEILLWTGLFIAGLGHYEGLQWLAICSPVFVYGLLTRGSGVPLLQERALAKWGHLEEFAAYQRRTNLLIPLPKLSSTAP